MGEFQPFEQSHELACEKQHLGHEKVVADQYAYHNDDGDVKGFYKDGSPKKSGLFTDGKMDGKFLHWYPNGQLRYEENYGADSLKGRLLGFSETGDTITDDHH